VLIEFTPHVGGEIYRDGKWVEVKRWGRVSFLCPISPELLEIGPEVCNVLVVLDADKCNAGARHFLHRRADIFGESFLAPGDAGRFIGWRVVETVGGAALAAIDAVEPWAELDFGVRPDLVAGGAQSLEHLLAGSGVLSQCRSGRSCNSYSSNHPCPQHFFSTGFSTGMADPRFVLQPD